MVKNPPMILGISGLTVAELKPILKQLKTICQNDEQRALELLDAELYSINQVMNESKEVDDNHEQRRRDRSTAKFEVNSLENDLTRAETFIAKGGKRNTDYPTWATDLETKAAELGSEWLDDVKQLHEEKIQSLKSRAAIFAEAYRAETIERSRDQLKELELQVEADNFNSVWDLPDTEQFINNLDFSWDDYLKEKQAGEYERLKAKVHEIEKRATTSLHTKAILEAQENPPSSPAKIKSALKKLQLAESFFRKANKLDDQLLMQFQLAKECIAWQRARKMLDEAEVAEAGGNTKKYLKLRAQAKIALRQDWVRYLGAKSLPNLENIPEFRDV